MESHRSLNITSALSGQTLTAVVRQFLGNVSWKDARRLIAARRVRVNGTVCLDDARRLKAGDVVDITPESHAPPSGDARIVYVDADLVVVDKPAGMQTVRRVEERQWSDERKGRQPVLEEVVARMLAGVKGHREKSVKIRAVHRLDRDTSGLMMFALSGRAEQELVRRFAAHEIARIYRAVVLGQLAGARTIETWIVRDRGDGIRGSVGAGNRPLEAQRAVTHIRTIEQIGDAYTIVECTLETGRTHQIRIHLAKIEHMLCGEKVYVRPKPGAPMIEDRSGAPRQALHSAELEFNHPMSGKSMRYESPWPTDLARWIATLRKQIV